MTIMVRSCDLLWDHMTYAVKSCDFYIHSVYFPLCAIYSFPAKQ